MSHSRDWSKIGVLLAALFIAGFFVSYTTDSLRVEFSQDDLMNCYRGWERPLGSLIGDNLLFWRFSPTFRPFCALIYKASHALFGFEMLPMRILLWLILAANSVLVYLVVRRLTNSIEAGLLGALLISYNRGFWALYLNTGTIYDIFCFFFYFWALAYYLRIRGKDRYPGPLQLLWIALLYIFSLDSKELGVSMPAAILFYELLFHTPRWRGLGGWLVREARAIWLTGVITFAYILGRVIGPDSISQQGGYAVKVSFAEYFKQLANYLGEIFYCAGWFNNWKALVLVCAMLLGVFVFRSRVLGFAWLFFTVGFLPMAFIPPRSPNAIYVPLAGIALYGAALLVEIREELMRLARLPQWKPAGQVLLFLALACFLIHIHTTIDDSLRAFQPEYDQIRRVREEYTQHHPTMKRGARILILKDPFKEYPWATIFITGLLYRDPAMYVERLELTEAKPDAAGLAAFDYIFTFEDDKLIELDHKYVAPPGLIQ
ncbi:MAG: glycosyltransferase family 39 protein [Bryobacteraceae bacterium]